MIKKGLIKLIKELKDERIKLSKERENLKEATKEYRREIMNVSWHRNSQKRECEQCKKDMENVNNAIVADFVGKMAGAINKLNELNQQETPND